MKDDNGLNREFFYLYSSYLDLDKSNGRIDDIWKKILLNKVSLIPISIGGDTDSYVDSFTEHSLMKGNCFRTFKKNRL